ncbi:putative alpha/beta hydrolases superfamily protein [Tanacetum coccineum]
MSRLESSTIMSLSYALEKEGITAFHFDFVGNGESGGTFQYANYRREADDLYSVIQHFHEANCVTRAILRHSKSGNVVLLYASIYDDVHRVINVSDVTEEDGFIDVKARTCILADKFLKHSYRMRNRVLPVHGSDDSVVRVEEALGFAKVIPNHKLQIIKGANHRFSKHRDELASIVLSFIKEPLNQ